MKLERLVKDDNGFLPQIGALCWRRHDEGLQILLVTSRETGRWVIPKGWPMDGILPHDAALTEAWEEAGIKGTAAPMALGTYTYDKIVARRTNQQMSVPCIVSVYPVAVTKLSRRYPESKQRRRKWMSPKKAAAAVDEKGLAKLITTFDPS